MNVNLKLLPNIPAQIWAEVILEYVSKYTKKNNRSPMLLEISHHLEKKSGRSMSKQRVGQILKIMAANGQIKLDPRKPRGIRLIEAPNSSESKKL